ncbi:MAG: hypothetical protein IPK59_07015 [Rhodospirillaceae bacterium]|nr:hypothetical protein [Rhodospirillaceae bacterium]
MKKQFWLAAVAAAPLILGGCEFFNNAIRPSVSGAPVGANVASSAQVPPGQPTGTLVGTKVIEVRSDLNRLQQAVQQQALKHQELRSSAERNAAGYQTTVGAINGKLQMGTTPGNPAVTGAWQQAQGQLDQIGSDLDQMNRLSNDVSNNAAFSSYLLDSIRAAYTVSGAVDEDHRQLRILEDQTNQTTVSIDRLLNQLSEDMSRQTNFLATERSNLTTLAAGVNSGQVYGTTLAARSYAPPAQPALPPMAGMSTGRPLVVIRFDRNNVNYEQALYQATSKALELRPNAAFDVVGVAPAMGQPAQVALNSDIARTNANRVSRSLLNMGLPPDRVGIAQVTDPNAQVNEVHVYVR